MFWLTLTVFGAANRHDAKRQGQSNGKEGDEAAGDLPDGTDLPPPPPKPKSKEKSNGKEVTGECMVLSVNVETQAHKLCVLACPVTYAKSCAMHRVECCCMSRCLFSPALSLCNPASICTTLCNPASICTTLFLPVSVCLSVCLLYLKLCTCMCKHTCGLPCSCLSPSVCLCI